MIFILLSLTVLAIVFVIVVRKHVNRLRRECAYGCVKAYAILKTPKDYQALQSHFATLKTPEERYFYSVSASRLISTDALKRWTEDCPDSADALLCYGARLVQWSWSARGYGRGADVSEENWMEFFRRLDLTREVLLKCAEQSPEDPTPWAYLIMVATWHSDSDDVKYDYFDQAVKRDPTNWAAHMHMIIALSEKWGGSNQRMLEFARQASKNAPDGSDVKAILVKAYIEYWKYMMLFDNNPEAADQFINDARIQEDIVQAYRDSLGHEDFVESKVSIFVRYNLSGWFWIVRDKAHLATQLRSLGNKLEDIHWRWVGTEGELGQAWMFVES